MLCHRENCLINPNLNFFQAVLNEPGENLSGSLGIVHQYVNMTTEVVNPYDPVSETFYKVSFCNLLIIFMQELGHSNPYPAYRSSTHFRQVF